MGICDVCLMGLTSSLEGTSIWGYPGKWSRKKKQDRGKETLKLIMIDVKQGFVWGYSGSKILGGCTREERMGYMNLERIHVFPCILGRKIRNSENAALMYEGDSKTTMSMPFWQIVVRYDSNKTGDYLNLQKEGVFKSH